ncbi:LPXTG cell wall anchor domain-containing protein [Salinicoccus hispanicus]|uniref:LPXTG cell wall anchor domain-containing protein n=2 Tax=Salinicoccus hispanicus TaxID=157225 RepID=A0A6N8U304_9STAP|nr:LPXTG cell wall anchor domain-containing protein [Salinicoccus hispanicus]MXQ52143.1 LPXTG cell wall anchor domain-containing protein [Salinicoccus hispanicus]
MKSSIASLLIASTLFISYIDTVIQAEEAEAEATTEEAVMNEDVQVENTEEASSESVEAPSTDENTAESSEEPSTEAAPEDVLVSATPDDSDETEAREAAMEAHGQNDESQESGTSAELSSEQPGTPPLETDEGYNTVPEPTEEVTGEPVTEEAPTTEPETGEIPTSEPVEETPASEETVEETIEETNQPPTSEVPVQEDEGTVAEEPVVEPVEPSSEVPASGSETDGSGFAPYPEVENDYAGPGPSEAQATEKKRYFRYDYGNILEGITLQPGASEAELGLLDKRVNRLLSARIMEESEVDEADIYEIEEKIKNEEAVSTSTSREILPDTGETNYTFIYGTVLFISGIILLFIMRKPKHNK